MSEVKCGTCKGTKHLEFEQGQRRVPCVTCSGSGIDWRKSCESAQSELAALREESDGYKATLRFNEGKDYELQQRLTAAEQRNAELVELLQSINAKASKSHVSQSLWQLKTDMANIAQTTDAALKPTESGASDAQ